MYSKNEYRHIHETVIRDILDVIDGIKNNDEVQMVLNKNKSKYTSIARETAAMTLVFPLACSRGFDIRTASMFAKAQERKIISMLQILFAANMISDAKSAKDYIANFHTNIKLGSLSVDNIVDLMDKYSEAAAENLLIPYDAIKELSEDYKYASTYCLSESCNDTPLYVYSVTNEAKGNNSDNPNMFYNDSKKSMSHIAKSRSNDDHRRRRDEALAPLIAQRDAAGRKPTISAEDLDLPKVPNRYKGLKNHSRNNGGIKHTRPVTKNQVATQYKHEPITPPSDDDDNSNPYAYSSMRLQKDTIDILKAHQDALKTRLMDNDAKKSNELAPSMMVVNFIADTTNSTYTFIIGIKVKLIPLDSQDIINHIILKTQNSNYLLKLIRATTREISFIKDFMFAIDKAKLDALSQSRKGSASKLWKILERRALKARIRNGLYQRNDAMSITTLVITQEEVEYIKKYYNININDSNVARKIMEGYNLLCLVIGDNSTESASFLYDTGDDMFEDLSYSSLEKENGGETVYKKVVNLMNKMK